MLTIQGTGGPRYLGVDANSSQFRLEVKRYGRGGPALLTRLPREAAVLRLLPDSGRAENDDYVTVTEVGWLQAYPRLLWRLARRLLNDRKSVLTTAGTAFSLLTNGQFAEFRRRMLRRSDGVDATRDLRGPDSLTTGVRIRRHKSDGGPIRTVMCTHSLNRDGAPISLFELTIALAKRRIIDPVVVSPVDGPLRKDYEARSIAVFIHDSGVAQALNAAAYDRVVGEFGEFLHARRAELVYANTSRTFFAVEAADRLHLPNIWNLRESEASQRRFEDFSMEIQDRAARCLTRADRLIFVAEATRDVWGPFPEKAGTMVIHNALDPERLKEADRSWTRKTARQSLGIETGDLSLICVGTICRRKGQLDLIKAASRMTETMLAHLWIDLVGPRDAEYERELMQELETLAEPVRARIRLFDETALVARHYIGADVFVCPSRSESYPRVILEAMARGLAVIATPVYGIREQLSDTESGLFYDPGDIGALVARITELVENPAMREQLGNGALRAFERKSDFRGMIGLYADAIREVSVEEAAQ